jgi:hypothetical protein
MTTVFEAFREIDYSYLEISRGEVYGNRILNETPLRGVFKLRSGMTQVNNQETRESSATLHVHPEDFKSATSEEIVGNGVRYDGKDYTIIGMTEGRNFGTGTTEHLTFTLERAEYVSQS